MGHAADQPHQQLRPGPGAGILFLRYPTVAPWRAFLATGFLGAYTTYSAFALETVLLLDGGALGSALAYSAGRLIGGLALVWAGMLTARAVPRP